jgi:hypothetical protein
MKLKHLMPSGVKSMRQLQRKMIKEAKSSLPNYSRPIMEIAITSGGFSKDEIAALQGFFEFRGRMPILNERTIKVIDRELDDKFIQEGIMSWLKNLGSKAWNALKGGWEALKKLWGNFKEMVNACIASIKAWMTKTYNVFKDQLDSKIQGPAQKAASELESVMSKPIKENRQKLREEDAASPAAKMGMVQWASNFEKRVDSVLGITEDQYHPNLSKESAELTDSTKYIGKKLVGLQDGEGWQDPIENGDDAAARSVELDPNLKENVRAVYNEFFSNGQNVKQLRTWNLTSKTASRILKEFHLIEGGLVHPEDLLKSVEGGNDEEKKNNRVVLMNVIKVVLTILRYTLGIFATMVGKIGALVSKNIARFICFISSSLGGPGKGAKMVAFGFFMGELLEVSTKVPGFFTSEIAVFIEGLIDAMAAGATSVMPWAAPVIDVIAGTMKGLGYFFAGYALATIIINIIIPVSQAFSKWRGKSSGEKPAPAAAT